MNYPAYYPQFAPQTAYQPPRMEQQTVYPLSQQAAQAQPVAQSVGFSTRPVTSREEALGVQVDFFGPGTLMPDLGHGKIYLKKFNQNTGSSDLYVFALEQETAAERTAEPQYATRQDLERVRGELERLIDEVDSLRRAGRGLVSDGN